MTISALALILAAAVIHATWNFLNKHAGGHATFTWLVAILSALLYAPATITIIEVWQIQISFVTIGIMAGSAALHTAYFVLLNQGYRVGDLSLVYPLARGTGPLLSSLAAIVFLGERPSHFGARRRPADHWRRRGLDDQPHPIAPERHARRARLRARSPACSSPLTHCGINRR